MTFVSVALAAPVTANVAADRSPMWACRRVIMRSSCLLRAILDREREPFVDRRQGERRSSGNALGPELPISKRSSAFVTVHVKEPISMPAEFQLPSLRQRSAQMHSGFDGATEQGGAPLEDRTICIFERVNRPGPLQRVWLILRCKHATVAPHW